MILKVYSNGPKKESVNTLAEAKLARVATAREAMDSAGAKIGMEHITHHDLRHLFATTCIESGMDIPTVSKWLGHKDGGALALKRVATSVLRSLQKQPPKVKSYFGAESRSDMQHNRSPG